MHPSQFKKKNTQKILEYLSRYVFRIAITDRRILEVKDGKVRFSWKDYRTGRFRQMKLDVDKFIRRFLLHVYVQPKLGGFRLNRKKMPDWLFRFDLCHSRCAFKSRRE